MLIEYAIAAGEGTLVDYGVRETPNGVFRILFDGGAEEVTLHNRDGDLRVSPAPPDCTTGE